MKYSEFFGRRKNTFEQSFNLINHLINQRDNRQKYVIVELGTSRSFVSGGYPGCLSTDTSFWHPNSPALWDWGAGVFTKVFSENLKGENVVLYSVDPNENAIFISSVICQDNKEVIIIRDDSTHFLKSIDFKIDFLYMDHMESSEEACIQHLEDSKILVERDLMSDHGIILIDDVGNTEETKGKYSIPYLTEHGFKKVMHEYQALLTKAL